MDRVTETELRELEDRLADVGPIAEAFVSRLVPVVLVLGGLSALLMVGQLVAKVAS